MAEDQTPEVTEATIERPRTIRFHYIKSPLFRTILVEGAYGGVSPRGYINMAIYTDRRPIPVEMTCSVNPDNTLGDPIEGSVISKEGIVREVEAEIVMDLAAAESLQQWIASKIEFLKAIRNQEPK